MMKIFTSRNYLAHHGVKGQKWGVRRYQKKDGSLTPAGKKRVSVKQMRKEKDQYREKVEKRLLKEYGVDDLRKKAFDYGRKHNLDLDDGGGGSKKAGDEYMKRLRDIDKAETKAKVNAGKAATNHIMKKYGKKAVNKIERRENREDFGMLMALPAILVTEIIKSNFKSHKTKKQQKG